MIPIRLEIQGLYSYREKRVVDFRQLTAAGLFGIFGAVGSGKSSILEAILLALYGSTERLSDRGEKNSMLNLQSDQLLINFEFKGGKNNTQSYLARYAAKRSNKNFNEVRPAEHTFYQVIDGKPVALEEKAESILGMKKDHFKQTVIIPQGKFREFIDLTPGPRADMMKELFGLEKFDLAGKTASLLKSAREDKIRLETQLAAFSSITEETLKEQETRLDKLFLAVREAETGYKKTEAEFRLQEGYEKSFKALEGFRREWEEIEAQQPVIEEKKKNHQEYLKAKTYLKPIWDSIQELAQEEEKFRVSVANCTRFKDEYVTEIQSLEEEERKLREKAELRPVRESKMRDLQKVIEIQQLLAALSTAQQQLEYLQPDIEINETALKKTESDIKALEKGIEDIQLPNSSQLADWKSASKEWVQWELVQTKAQNDAKQLETTEIQLKSSIQTLKQELPQGEDSFEGWLTNHKKEILALEAEREALLGKKGLATHAHLLTNGEPCPLCGSLDHPDPLKVDKEAEFLESTTRKIQKAKEEESRIVECSQQLKEEFIRLGHQQTLLSEKRSEALQAQQKLDELKKTFNHLSIDSKEGLEKLVQQTDQAVVTRENLLKSLQDLRTKADKYRETLETEREKAKSIHQQTLSLSSAVETKKEEVKDEQFCQPFYQKDTKTIQETIEKVRRDIEETASKLEGKRKVLQETRTKEATNLANLTNFRELLESTTKKRQQQQEKFQQAMQQHGFSDEETVKNLFQHSLDADAVDAAIRKFEDRSLLVKAKIQELEQDAGVSAFNPETFDLLYREMERSKSEWDQQQHEFTLLQQQVKENQTKLQEKTQLEKVYADLTVRDGHLKELDTLFRGSGFVKYVSSIYLKELCNTANLRFRKLTKNSLSLEIDDNNTFWVVDYLNGGKRRLLKTLSGGQTFQASLCLALALAEKVKSLNQADQSFFFLDEGFGALDRSSLRVVFETLKSLRHENRIVGIISHVEELQQEIEVYAKVSLDPERGSQVSYSYISMPFS